MVDVEGYTLPDDLYYHKEHMWVKLEGDSCVVGVNDFAQKLAGEISYIELPVEGEVKQDEEVGTIETGKWVGKLFAPLSGEITGVNESLEDDPTLVNKDPYEEGWIYKMTVKDQGDLGNLLKGDKAVEWLKKEIKEHV